MFFNVRLASHSPAAVNVLAKVGKGLRGRCSGALACTKELKYILKNPHRKWGAVREMYTAGEARLAAAAPPGRRESIAFL